MFSSFIFSCLIFLLKVTIHSGLCDSSVTRPANSFVLLICGHCVFSMFIILLCIFAFLVCISVLSCSLLYRQINTLRRADIAVVLSFAWEVVRPDLTCLSIRIIKVTDSQFRGFMIHFSTALHLAAK